MATQVIFDTQPNNTTKGYTLQGANYKTVNLAENQGIRVAATDATGLIVDPTVTGTVTLSFGTNPTAGSVLNGTLTQPFVNGIAVFNDLSVSLAGVGYTLTTANTAGLTNATSNPFTEFDVKRINPNALSGSIAATGLANAIGPFRYRGGSEMFGVAVITGSATAGDAASVFVVPPGATLSATNAAAAATITAQPGYKLVQLANDCDVYVSGTTITTTMSVLIESAQYAARV